MNAVLSMCKQGMLEGLTSVTGSPESEAGRMRSDLLEYQTNIQYGRQAYHASLSAQPESNSEKMTKDTCYRTTSTWLSSADLQHSLANRLQARLSTDGHVIYKQQWKQKVTPSGITYWAHTASVRSTNDKDFIGWPTATTRDWKDGKVQNVPINSLLGRTVWLTDWGTPRTVHPSTSLEQWEARNKRCKDKHGKGMGKPLELQAVLAAWASPTLTDANRGVKPPRPHDTGIPLTQQVGQILNGSNAETTNSGQLNPALSRWLMGFPPEWCDCAVTAMQSFRK